jgi:hypothetical protein
MPAVPLLKFDNQHLTNLALDNQQIPQEGSKASPIRLDFTLADAYDVDIQNIQARGFLSMVQTLFIDMSQTDASMTILINGSLQRIVVKGRTQGYYCVMCPVPTKMLFTCPGGPQDCIVYFINVPIPGHVWATL